MVMNRLFSISRVVRVVIVCGALAGFGAVGAPLPVFPQASATGVKLEWLTWSFFRLTSIDGKVILTNPWLSNPDSQTELEDIDKADIILVATGHRDEIGEALEIANKTGARIVTTWEIAEGTLKGKVPDKQLIRTQPGSVLNVDGIKIRVVNALHGSGVTDRGYAYGGPALGFFITFENGYTLFFSGSTDITMDMQLWGALFKPHAAIIYYSESLDPMDVAHMIRLLSADNPNLKIVIPHHHRLESRPGKAPEDLAKAMKKLGLKAQLLNPTPGQSYEL
jgi:L-ascorbate metabolism protein UlaG (beta-lactamase superfamily)